MKTQLYTAVRVLISAGLATAQTYHIPTVSLDTPDNSVCPPDAQLEAVRNSISGNLSDILVEIAVNKTTILETTITIPECGGSGWRQVAFLDMTDPDQTCPSSWRLYSQDSVRACGRQETNIGSCEIFCTLTTDSGMALLDVMMLAAVLLTLVRGLTLS